MVDDNKLYIGKIKDEAKSKVDPFYEDNIASYLSDRLNTEDAVSLKYYRILAHYLTKPQIDRLVGTAMELGRNPARYFCVISKIELEKARYKRRGRENKPTLDPD